MDKRVAEAFARLVSESCLALGEGDRLRIAAGIAPHAAGPLLVTASSRPR